LTAERKVAAAKEVTYGISVQLDLRNDSIKLPAFGRLGIQHKVIDYEHITGEFAHDDELAFNTQSGSQWDGFLHYADQKIGTYFNGVRHSDSREAQAEAAGIHCMCVHVSLSNGTLTVSTDWCEQGIVARGVLLDWVRWCQDTTGTTIAPISTHGNVTSVQHTAQRLPFQSRPFCSDR
jgi:hypothetical protein